MKAVSQIPVGIKASIITHAHQLRSAFAVRHEAYCFAGLMACDLPAEAPHDQWDTDSRTSQYLATDNGLAIGSARAIDGDSIHGLQASSFIDLNEDTSGLVEISRVALSPSYRGNRHEALAQLIGAVIQHQWSRGRYEWVQTMRGQMASILARRLHIPFVVSTVIDDFDRTARGVPLTGEPLYLARVDLRHVAAHTFVRDHSIYRSLFGRSDPLIEATAEENLLFAEQIRSTLSAVRAK